MVIAKIPLRNWLDELAAYDGSEGYILDKLLVRVLVIKLQEVLDDKEIAFLDNDEHVNAGTESAKASQKIAAKVGVHFSEHFGLTMDAAASEPQELFKKINNICPLSVTVARAWLLANSDSSLRPNWLLRGLCAKMIMKCMNCTLKIHERYTDMTELESIEERIAQLDEYLNVEMADMRLHCGQSQPFSCSAIEKRAKSYVQALEELSIAPLLDTLNDTTLADHWVDRNLLQEPTERPMPYDNILKVRTMLEGRAEAKDYHDDVKRNLELARQGVDVDEIANVDPLKFSLWKGKQGAKRDHWSKSTSRIWSRVPVWILAQGITERGSSYTASLFSVIPVLIASAMAPTFPSVYYVGKELVTTMFTEYNLSKLTSPQRTRNRKA